MMEVVAVLVGAAIVSHVVLSINVVVHERLHAFALAYFGCGSRIELETRSIRGHRVPGYVAGTCYVHPYVDSYRLSPRQDAAVSLAPLAITVATAPVVVGAVVALNAPVLLVPWLLVFGPSRTDWAMAVSSLLGESNYQKPELGADLQHRFAEGMSA